MFSLSSSVSSSYEFKQLYIEKIWTNDSLICVMFYSHVTFTNFWDLLQRTGASDLYMPMDDIFVDNINDTQIASKLVVNEVMKQLTEFLEIRNITNIPMPLAAFTSVWCGDEFYGDAINFWKQGYNIDNVVEEISHPMEDEDIYIAISDYSTVTDYANFIEGAFIAAMDNLVNNFEITDLGPFTDDAAMCQPQA
eukprot:158746_1